VGTLPRSLIGEEGGGQNAPIVSSNALLLVTRTRPASVDLEADSSRAPREFGEARR
jgi:hypothetical protein